MRIQPVAIRAVRLLKRWKAAEKLPGLGWLDVGRWHSVRRLLRNQVFDNSTVDIGQAEVSA
jgi:hypothetical protein